MRKSRVLYVVSVLLSILLAFGYHESWIGFTLLYALLFILVFSLISVLIAPRFITMKEVVDKGVVFRNQSVCYELQLRNRAPFFYPEIKPVYYVDDILEYDLTEQATQGLPLFGKSVIKNTIRCPYRGVYHVGIKEIIVTDFFGLFRARVPQLKPLVVKVYPEYVDHFEHFHSNEDDTPTPQQYSYNEDYSTVSDVRAYQQTDSLKKIHWKVSAKRGELMVKNFEAFESSKVALFVDRTEVPLERKEKVVFEDQLILYVAGAISYCKENQLDVDLIYGDAEHDRLSIPTTGEVDMAFDLLARMEFDREYSGLDTISQVSGITGVMLFLSHIDQYTYDIIQYLLTFHYGVTVYYFYTPSMYSSEIGEYIKNLDSLGVDVYAIQMKGGATVETKK